MSTRCRIGRVNSNGTVDSIYCHHDGYTSYVGKKLVDNYTDYNINQLLELGDLSSLGNNPVADPEAWTKFNYNEEFCVAYNTRGEDTHYITSQDIGDFLEMCEDAGDIEYAYLLIDNKWMFWTIYDGYDLYKSQELKEPYEY